MIDPNDLRVGNVIELTETHTAVVVADITVGRIHLPSNCIIAFEWFEGIRLTPAVLSSCGMDSNTALPMRPIKMNNKLYQLVYLHELQNFYFDLTGEELKVNL